MYEPWFGQVPIQFEVLNHVYDKQAKQGKPTKAINDDDTGSFLGSVHIVAIGFIGKPRANSLHSETSRIMMVRVSCTIK
jgi:hypothetical protein